MTIGFLDLPAELRNCVYTYALKSAGRIKIWEFSHRIRYEGIGANYSVEPALLRTSRQLRRESLPIFYGSNVFLLSNSLDRRWLQSLSVEKLKMLRQVNRDCNTTSRCFTDDEEVVRDYIARRKQDHGVTELADGVLDVMVYFSGQRFWSNGEKREVLAG